MVENKSIAIPLEIEKASLQWNALVGQHKPVLTHAHNPSLYNFYKQYLRAETWYLLLSVRNTIIGLLPVTRTKTNYFSLPHLSYGGIVWLQPNPAFGHQTTPQLINWLKTEKPASGFYEIDLEKLPPADHSHPRITWRSTEPINPHDTPPKAVYWMPLNQDKPIQDTFSSPLRRKIRSAERKGITVKTGRHDLLPEFMALYQANNHQLGSPALGIKFFSTLLSVCTHQQATITIAYHQHKPIGAGFWLSYAGFCENTHFATLRQHNHLYTTYALHWTMIQHAQNNGNHTYSFGRSTPHSTVEKYKLQWPVTTHPLYYHTTHPTHTTLTTHTWLTKLWKHLPTTLVNTLSPPIAKRIY